MGPRPEIPRSLLLIDIPSVQVHVRALLESICVEDMKEVVSVDYRMIHASLILNNLTFRPIFYCAYFQYACILYYPATWTGYAKGKKLYLRVTRWSTASPRSAGQWNCSWPGLTAPPMRTIPSSRPKCGYPYTRIDPMSFYTYYWSMKTL